ncbi:MAG: hypothetical protein JWQ04_3046, partial [Pedosphaera sp.]|nr:hypothetical protein [Pedosphaera sp.]
AKRKAYQTSCLSNLKEIGVVMAMYLGDNNDHFPDRGDLKNLLPGGWKPWTSWPPSDPRAGWAGVFLQNYNPNYNIWTCPGIQTSTPVNQAVQVTQAITNTANSPVTQYWMWRFDRPNDPSGEDFWGKTPDRAFTDLAAANDPTVGFIYSISDVEITVDPYFPNTIPTVDPQLSGHSGQPGGRNRLLMDWHVQFFKDKRVPN